MKNWRDYDAALRQRGDLTVWVTPAVIAAWMPPHNGKRGRPQQYSAIAVETGLLLRLTFGRPWRQTEGMLASILRLLGLDLPVPDHTTFSRRSANLGDVTLTEYSGWEARRDRILHSLSR
ncbi:DDE family transposase [Microvirga subterranea]|uniref:DDE family transposase n=1 Tax=Microvirga subterranea TaxID=186651 RepID=A0A370H2I5_9HYPH|nr:DDE family transposase [Microvirga subterranea]